MIARVSFSNLHGGQSWLNYFPWNRVNHPLLFDRAGKPKPAYDAVIKAVTVQVPLPLPPRSPSCFLRFDSCRHSSPALRTAESDQTSGTRIPFFFFAFVPGTRLEYPTADNRTTAWRQNYGGANRTKDKDPKPDPVPKWLPFHLAEIWSGPIAAASANYFNQTPVFLAALPASHASRSVANLRPRCPRAKNPG